MAAAEIAQDHVRERILKPRRRRLAAALDLQRIARGGALRRRLRRGLAAVTLQAAARQRLAAKRARERRRAAERAAEERRRREERLARQPVSAVGRIGSLFEMLSATVARENALNPLSSAYVGPAEHRRRIEAEHGKLQKYGKPTQLATERALPGQLATCLNVLRFVDAVNGLLSRQWLQSPYASMDGVPYNLLMSWNDRALQARYSAAAQYLRSGKKFGMLHFEGEYPAGDIVVFSCSVGRTRRELLESILSR